MKTLLQQLENNEAILLMYLADELPADDRREVEFMLERDPYMRRDLEALRATQAHADALFAAADARSSLPVAKTTAERNVNRAIEQWAVQRLVAAKAASGPARSLRFPWWCYPVAAAASVLVAFLVWWGHTELPVVSGRADDVVATVARPGFTLWQSFDDLGEVNEDNYYEAVSLLDKKDDGGMGMLLSFDEGQDEQ